MTGFRKIHRLQMISLLSVCTCSSLKALVFVIIIKFNLYLVLCF